MKFGIDLVGGTYITLGVQQNKALEEDMFRRLRSLETVDLEQGGAKPLKQVVQGSMATVTYASAQDAAKASGMIAQAGVDLTSSVNNDTVVYKMAEKDIKTIEREAIGNNIHVLRSRLDGFGVGEIPISSQGDDKIVVELPDVHNFEQAKEMLGKTALLEFKLVEDAGSSKEELEDRFGGQIPETLMILPGHKNNESRFYLVSKYADVTGRMLKDARGQTNEVGAPVIGFTFNTEGARKFAQLTRENIGRSLAIIIDNEVILAANISTEIRDSGIITGQYTMQQASAMARMLKSGAFAAPVTIEEERHIGPSIGQESTRQGLVACVVGLILLFIFSVAFYKTAGLIAFIVLLYNLMLTLFGLKMIGATLTLPGIAGMVLSIGMAIDASILIYERIREELALGLPLGKAIDVGFSDALEVILDANITHFLVAAVLYYFGTGPIQGFALTMIVGIVATLLTGLLLLRFLLKFIVQVLGVRNLRF